MQVEFYNYDKVIYNTFIQKYFTLDKSSIIIKEIQSNQRVLSKCRSLKVQIVTTYLPFLR